MMKFLKGFLLSLLLPAAAFGENTFSVFNLRCEQAVNPLGVETMVPRFSWQIRSDRRNFVQSKYEILVADNPDDLSKNKGSIWDSGKVESDRSILVHFGGTGLKSGATYYWKVRVFDAEGNPSPWSEAQSFSMGLLSDKDWGGARWIALEADREAEKVNPGLHGSGEVDKRYDRNLRIGMYRLPQFRKEFKVAKPVRRAVAYVSGLGHFDMYLNGEKVGDHFLDPGWSKYEKEALYVPLDVTEYLRDGDNAVGVMLGNGFFNIPRERYFKLLASNGAPRLIMNIRVEYEDGQVENIVTDGTWRAAESAITYSSIYGGEDYDAGREQRGWTSAGFDDSSWQEPLCLEWKTKLMAQVAAPLTVRDSIPTVRTFRNGQGRWVYDLGQNFSGVVRVALKAGGRQSVKLWPAELLNPDSTINQSASGAPYWFGYTTAGAGLAEWQPQFTYYGFRYVEVEGAVPAGEENPDGLPEIVALKGLHTCNSADETGTFHCSNQLFNRTYELIDWAIRSNFASVLTDCPHREKLGWLEQAHLMQYSVQYRYSLARMYSKIMSDMRASQTAEGMIPDIAPEYVEFEGGFRDTPEWGSAFIISPWYVYLWYGDTRLIEKYYPAMQEYLRYLQSQAKDNIVAYGLGDWFDIGPGNPGFSQLTSNGVTATAIYYYDVCLMQKMATLLGRKDDAKQYGDLAEQIKASFNATFWDPATKTYDRNSQTANAIALYMGLTTEENHRQVFDNLVADIRGRGNALTAGDVGYRYVLRALEENGASDIIYDMNSKYDTPGYGWQLAHGATALTESWQAYGFVSNNHFMLGHLMEWLFSGLGGIRQSDESVAFRHVVIRPTPVGDVRSARTSYESPYGTIVADWKQTDDTYSIQVEVPANSQATVYLPTDDPACVTESGVAIDGNFSHKAVEEGGAMTVEVGSGIYRFVVKK